jgi:hypothetical protein
MQTFWYPLPAAIIRNWYFYVEVYAFSISGVQKCARIVFEVVIVQRASVAVASAHALLLTENVIPMCAETAG